MRQWRWPWSAKRAAQAPRPLTVEELENRNLLSIAVGALGDSITAPYQGGPKGIGGDRSWAELLQTLRGPEDITVANVAHDGRRARAFSPRASIPGSPGWSPAARSTVPCFSSG